VVFIALVFSNWGELRFYVFMGILSGLVLYYNWLSLYIIRLFSSIIRLLMAGLLLIKKVFMGVLIRPVVYCMKLVGWPFVFVSRKATEWYHSRWPKPPDGEE